MTVGAPGRTTQSNDLDLLWVREQGLEGIRSGHLFSFSEKQLFGIHPEGAALHPVKGGLKWNGHLADGAFCICISALSDSCSLPLFCSTPEPLGIVGLRSACWETVWGSVPELVSRREEGTSLCCSCSHLLFSGLLELALKVTAAS